MTGSRSTLAPELLPQLIPTFFTFFISLTLHLPFLQTHLYQGIDRKSTKISIFELSRSVEPCLNFGRDGFWPPGQLNLHVPENGLSPQENQLVLTPDQYFLKTFEGLQIPLERSKLKMV